MESHPLRMRGLKQLHIGRGMLRKCRILYGCVDWNLSKPRLLLDRYSSHPLRMRGLKPTYPCSRKIKKSRILYGCVDWNNTGSSKCPFVPGRILYGCVDWNSANAFWNSADCSRILYGCVGWNIYTLDLSNGAGGTSFADIIIIILL